MAGTHEITYDEIVRAGRVLFGSSFRVSGGWEDALRATYRRRALETHPDRARALGRPERELAREFEAVSEAYRVLSRLTGPPPRSVPSPRGRPPPGARQAAEPGSRPWSARPARARAGEGPAAEPRGARHAPPGGRGPAQEAADIRRPAGGARRARAGIQPEDLPRRRLRFAEFLYYSGRVGWSDLVGAIAWQRAQRPPLGRIAVEFGFLSPADVGAILERRRGAGEHGTLFGEWAVRLGYLTPFQLLAALGRQIRLQRPIGQFFVERGVLESDEIDAIRRRILLHNARFRSRAR